MSAERICSSEEDDDPAGASCQSLTMSFTLLPRVNACTCTSFMVSESRLLLGPSLLLHFGRAFFDLFRNHVGEVLICLVTYLCASLNLKLTKVSCCILLQATS